MALLACIIFILFVFDAFKPIAIKQMTLLPLTIVIALIFVLVFDNRVRHGSNTTFSRFIAIMFCNTMLMETSIRVANLISFNGYTVLCDLISKIVIKLPVLIDIIDNIVAAGIIFNTIVDAVTKTEILMGIWIVYFFFFIINAFSTISRLIGAAIHLILC